MKRDFVICKLNLLQACWGIGKGINHKVFCIISYLLILMVILFCWFIIYLYYYFLELYELNMRPVKYTRQNSLCRFKAITESVKPISSSRDALVAMNIK